MLVPVTWTASTTSVTEALHSSPQMPGPVLVRMKLWLEREKPNPPIPFHVKCCKVRFLTVTAQLVWKPMPSSNTSLLISIYFSSSRTTLFYPVSHPSTRGKHAYIFCPGRFKITDPRTREAALVNWSHISQSTDTLKCNSSGRGTWNSLESAVFLSLKLFWVITLYY